MSNHSYVIVGVSVSGNYLKPNVFVRHKQQISFVGKELKKMLLIQNVFIFRKKQLRSFFEWERLGNIRTQVLGEQFVT